VTTRLENLRTGSFVAQKSWEEGRLARVRRSRYCGNAAWCKAAPVTLHDAGEQPPWQHSVHSDGHRSATRRGTLPRRANPLTVGYDGDHKEAQQCDGTASATESRDGVPSAASAQEPALFRGPCSTGRAGRCVAVGRIASSRAVSRALYAALALAASETIGVGLLPVPLRNPAVAAMEVASTQDATPR
jgi:hypothetical protein